MKNTLISLVSVLLGTGVIAAPAVVKRDAEAVNPVDQVAAPGSTITWNKRDAEVVSDVDRAAIGAGDAVWNKRDA